MRKNIVSALLLISAPLLVFAKPSGAQENVTPASVPARASASTATAPVNYENIYIVPNLDKIPRFVQMTRSEQDSNVCFAAAASQVIDLHRYNHRNIRGDNFTPSSPVLIASRVHHIRGSRDEQQGGPPNRAIEQSFRLGNCSTLAPSPNYNDGVLTIEEEFSAITQASRAAGAPASIRRQLSEGLFSPNNSSFFNRTYQFCQPGHGASFREDENFGSFAVENNGEFVTEEQWNTALRHAQNFSGGVQAIAIAACYQATDTSVDPGCNNHAMTIVGKRCPAGADTSSLASAGCQVLIRDSYLHTEASLPAGASFYSEIPNDRNDIWVSELAVKNATRLMHMIGNPPSGQTSAQRIGLGERERSNRENELREAQEEQGEDSPADK